MLSYFVIRTLSWFLTLLKFCKYPQLFLTKILNISQKYYITISLIYFFAIAQTQILMPGFKVVISTNL